ncbi:MAG: hypothetical protein JNL18_24540 [Planctomycetaceae bacterium]|nr:hypothetical protein [Planctomycetaceae bacterium]
MNSPPTAAPQTQPSQPRAPSLPVSNIVQWEVLGRSVEGRVIEFAQFGKGPHQVLVIGALEGDKPEGVAMAEFLAAHLARFPKRTGDVTVTIVRDPNPDGRARRTPTNARGVLLDRNFNTPGWQRQGPVTGPESDSEPETRGLAELLVDVQPERVVIFGTATSKATLGFTGPDEPLAKQVALEAGAQLLTRESMRIPGSLASYTGDDRGVPTLRMSFVPAANADAIWSEQKRAILTAVGCGSPLDFMPLVANYGPRKPRQVSGAPLAQPVQPLVGAVPPSAAPEVDGQPPPQPEMIRFESLKQGLPTVAIDRTRIRRTTESAFDELRTDAIATSGPPQTLAPMVPLAPQVAQPATPQIMQPAAMTTVPQPPIPVLQRLPPVESSFESPGRLNLPPARPIVDYPRTGS